MTKIINMKIEGISWLLERIKEGDNTLYLLRKQKKSAVVLTYITYSLENGFIIIEKENIGPRRKKIYGLTDKGERFLEMIKNR